MGQKLKKKMKVIVYGSLFWLSHCMDRKIIEKLLTCNLALDIFFSLFFFLLKQLMSSNVKVELVIDNTLCNNEIFVLHKCVRRDIIRIRSKVIEKYNLVYCEFHPSLVRHF